MARLIRDLPFRDPVKSIAEKRDVYDVFPAGTEIQRALLDMKPGEPGYERWNDCRKSIIYAESKGKKDFELWFVGGVCRMLDRSAYDSAYADRVAAKTKEEELTTEAQRHREDERTVLDNSIRDVQSAGELDHAKRPEEDGPVSAVQLVPVHGKFQTGLSPSHTPERADIQRVIELPAERSAKTTPFPGRATRTYEIPPCPGPGLPVAMGNVVIVDFSNLIHTAFHACGTGAAHSVLATCVNVIQTVSPEYLVFALDGGHVARSRMFEGYKATRPERAPELVEQIDLATAAIRAIGWPLIRFEGWEADDVIASLVHQVSGRAVGTLVASGDKDLLQLVPKCRIYHPWKGGKLLPLNYSEERFGVKANQIADYLALCGDTSDNVPGVNGVGEKTAASLLAQFGTLAGVLDAAATSRVAGAAAKKLVQQREMAWLSRRLVELKSDLPVPSFWLDFPAGEPSAGWKETLRGMGLNAAVNKLLSIKSFQTPGRVRGCSQVLVPWDEEESNVVPRDFGIRTSDKESTVVEVPSRDHKRDLALLEPRPVADVPTVPGESDFPARDGEASQPVVDRIPTDGDSERSDYQRLTDLSWCDDFPKLGALAKDANRETRLRSVYAAEVREMRAGNEYRQIYKSESEFTAVEKLARDGKPFSMPGLSVATKTIVDRPPPPPAAKPGERVQGSLF